MEPICHRNPIVIWDAESGGFTVAIGCRRMYKTISKGEEPTEDKCNDLSGMGIIWCLSWQYPIHELILPQSDRNTEKSEEIGNNL